MYLSTYLGTYTRQVLGRWLRVGVPRQSTPTFRHSIEWRPFPDRTLTETTPQQVHAAQHS